MKKVTVLNELTNRLIVHDLKDDFYEFFIQDRTEKGKFGLVARWLPLAQASEFELSREDDRREVEVQAEIPEYTYEELDLEGVPTGNIITAPLQPATYRTEIHVPDDFTVEITDITATYEAEQRRASLQLEGRNSRLCCEEIMDYIGGYNLSQAFTTEQITSMISTFSTINTYLKAYMPRSAKPLIAALEVSPIVSQVLKDDIADIFTKYGC
jgi:hypothetical protein